MKRRGKYSNNVKGYLAKKAVVASLSSLLISIGIPISTIGNTVQALQDSAELSEVGERFDEATRETIRGWETEGDRPSPQSLTSEEEAIPLTPQNQPRLRLRHGPYFPDLEVLEPPAPEPLWPRIVQPRRLVIRLSERRVYIYQGDEIQTTYPIAVGRSGWETPTGTYKVLEMQENPAWKNPFTGAIIPAGRNNPLGDRWIGFWTDGTNVIGFHGTPNEGSVGRAASHGCIRMFNQDVRALYAIVEVGMPVIVEP